MELSNTMQEPRLVSRQKASELLSLSVRAVDYLVSGKRLRTRRFGKRVLIPMTEINRLCKMDIGTIRPRTINQKAKVQTNG